MDFRQLGHSGLTVSVVGLGCNNFGRRLSIEHSRPVVDTALEEGINLFDTADTYGMGDSEAQLGEILKGRRDQAVLATKFGMDFGKPEWGARGSRRYIRLAVEGSLHRLQTDYIDLYQIHMPDPKTPLEETLAALHELVIEGKVRYVGSSNFPGWQVADAEWTARTHGYTRFISAQNEYSLLKLGLERHLTPACRQYGIGILPFFPLASGLLTGKHRRGQPAPEGTRMASMPALLQSADFDKIEALEKFAAGRGVSLLDVAIGGLASRPAVSSVIAGATAPGQVRANVLAGSWVPSEEDREALDKILGAPRP